MTINDIRKLVTDFRRWGRRATKRVQALTKEHGVICDEKKYSNGTMG